MVRVSLTASYRRRRRRHEQNAWDNPDCAWSVRSCVREDFAYATREKIVDIGPIHATREKTHNVPLPPIAGAVALIGGIVLLVARRKE